MAGTYRPRPLGVEGGADSRLLPRCPLGYREQYARNRTYRRRTYRVYSRYPFRCLLSSLCKSFFGNDTFFGSFPMGIPYEPFDQDAHHQPSDTDAAGMRNVERDLLACYEHDVFERKPNGSFGAMDGHHDDILITVASAPTSAIPSRFPCRPLRTVYYPDVRQCLSARPVCRGNEKNVGKKFGLLKISA